jgi:hypothetical protein
MSGSEALIGMKSKILHAINFFVRIFDAVPKVKLQMNVGNFLNAIDRRLRSAGYDNGGTQNS